MDNFRSSHFIRHVTLRDRIKHKILLFILIFAGIIMFFIFNGKTNCLVIKETENKNIIFIDSVKDKDEVVLSHNNSIYNAWVEEFMYVEKDTLILKHINTSSYGVKEYYNITDGFTPRSFTCIVFRNTKERGFSIKINGKAVEKIKKTVNTSLVIELVKMPIYRYYWIKMRTN